VIRVLLAHSCAATTGWLQLALLQRPARFEVVHTAWEALEHLAERPVSLLVTDRHLLGMSGPQLLAAARTAGLTTPAILLAPLCGDGVRSLAARAGRAVVVEDPYDAHALRRAAAVMLGFPLPAAHPGTAAISA
jgi:DNA-binding response OmpR family regulator